MLTISKIRNVQSTINNISFKAGVARNAGANNVINRTADVKNEGSFVTEFLGTLDRSPLFNTLRSRQESIEKGMENEERKINAIA